MASRKTVVIATRNPNKVREFREMFGQTLPWTFVSLDDLGVRGDAEESADTFTDNALLKARFYGRLTGRPCISEDAGLCVDALGGRPGVYSARWTGAHADDATNNAHLVRELARAGAAESPAQYRSAVAYVDGADEVVAEGVLEGVVHAVPDGTGGFAYDPHFFVNGRSLGTMTVEEKNRISHRGRAVAALLAKLLAR